MDPSICIDIFGYGLPPWGICLYWEYMKTVKGLRQSPRHPSAKCMTKILSYGVPFEKFSWCFRSEDFCINISADLHDCPMSLRLFMLLVFLYCSDLHLELTNPTCFIVLHASAVSHTTGPVDATPSACSRERQLSPSSSCRAFRASETALNS